MPKCPECKAEIDSLHECQEGMSVYSMQVKEEDGDLQPDYGDNDFYEGSAKINYDCPECGETLFVGDLEAALKFLAGK